MEKTRATLTSIRGLINVPACALTRAANVTLLIETTFLYIDTLAPQPATKILVLSVYHNLPSCPMKNWYTRGDSYED